MLKTCRPNKAFVVVDGNVSDEAKSLNLTIPKSCCVAPALFTLRFKAHNPNLIYPLGYQFLWPSIPFWPPEVVPGGFPCLALISCGSESCEAGIYVVDALLVHYFQTIVATSGLFGLAPIWSGRLAALCIGCGSANFVAGVAWI